MTSSPAVTARACAISAVLAAVLAVVLGTVQAPTARAVEWSPLVSDSFSRTISSGWGSADTGGTWATTTRGSASTSVSSGSGVMALPRGGTAEAWLPPTSQDLDATATFSLSAVHVVGSGAYPALLFRRQADGSAYHARLKVSSSGATDLRLVRTNGSTSSTLVRSQTLPLVVRAGGPVMLQAQVTGTNPVMIRARAWSAGGTAPAWQQTFSDASASRITTRGSVGMWSHIATTATASTTLVVDNLRASTATTTATPPTPITGVESLDPSGATLPATNYPMPSGAVVMSPSGSDANAGTVSAPVRSLSRAIAMAPVGGTIVLRGGVYRDSYSGSNGNLIFKSLTFQAYPGERPWLDGSDVVSSSSFTASNGRWVRSWSTPSFCRGRYYERAPLAQASDNSGPCAYRDLAVLGANDTLPSDVQQLWINGVSQTQVASLASVSAGKFFYDWSARKLYLGTDPAGRTVELTTRGQAMVLGSGSTVDSYALKGIGVRRYASTPHEGLGSGAIYAGGSRIVVENSVFAWNSAVGLSLGSPKPGSTISRTVFAHNGSSGITGHGEATRNVTSGLTIRDNVFATNVREGLGAQCNTSCSQGGVKLTQMQGFTMTRNLVQDSPGRSVGLWCDLMCRDGVFTYNTVRNVGDVGIFYEVSDRGIIAGNVVRNAKAGIQVASANTKVYHNTIVDTGADVAIRVYDDRRSYGIDGWHNVGPDTRNVSVVGNVIAAPKMRTYNVAQARAVGSPNTLPAEYFSALNHNLIVQNGSTNPVFMAWTPRADLATEYYRAGDRAAFAAKYKNFESASRWTVAAPGTIMPNYSSGDYALSTTAARSVNPPALPADVAAPLGLTATTYAPGAFLTR